MTQREAALERANEIKLGMAARRRELRAMDRASAYRAAAEWVADPDEVVGRMKVGYLLDGIPRVGKAKAAKYMRQIGLNTGHLDRRILKTRRDSRALSPDHTTVPLSLASRAALVALLEHEAKRAGAATR